MVEDRSRKQRLAKARTWLARWDQKMERWFIDGTDALVLDIRIQAIVPSHVFELLVVYECCRKLAWKVGAERGGCALDIVLDKC